MDLYHLKSIILCLNIFCYSYVFIKAMGLCEFKERSAHKAKVPPSCSRRGHSTEGVTALNVTPSEETCPTNMVLGNCQRCEATCRDPSGTENCQIVCIHAETCICPEGFLMNKQDCIPQELCPCFSAALATVIPEGTSHIDEYECGINCLCQDSVLSCDYNYNCDVNALCGNKDGGFQCYCREGYIGNGINCTALTDCLDVYHNGFTESGIYTIHPTDWPSQSFKVYCNMDDGGGWTVFQRRFDGHVDFYLNWENYEQGFGQADSECWLGNEKLYYLTRQKSYELRIDMTDKYQFHLHAVYGFFRMEGPSANYRISYLGNYSGSLEHDYFSFHLGMSFSTYDRDNDSALGDNCARKHHGAWWYKDCYAINLNGQYEGGEYTGMLLYNWNTLRTDYFLRRSEMKIRPI